MLVKLQILNNDFFDIIMDAKSSRKEVVPWVLIHQIDCESRSEALKLEDKIKKRGIRRFLNDNGYYDKPQPG